MLIDTVRCEVFNASYEPLNPISARRALRLYLDGKATILSEHTSVSVRSGSKTHPIPTRIVLNYMVRRTSPHVTAQLTNRNLFLRDGYTCQYCERHKKEFGRGETLTRDHVHPRDLGGQDVWENVATACNRCNNKKANKPLEKTGMKLIRKPYAPTRHDLWYRGRGSIKFEL